MNTSQLHTTTMTTMPATDPAVEPTTAVAAETDPNVVEIENPEKARDANHDPSHDPRHLRRIELMQKMFAYSFNLDFPEFRAQFADEPEIIALIEQVPELDSEIQVAAPERPLVEINKVDLAILRLIMFESKHKETPKKVLINEGIELAKEFGTDSSPRFINGVLAHLFGM